MRDQYASGYDRATPRPSGTSLQHLGDEPERAGAGVHGTVADGYEAVRTEFAEVLAEEPGDPGAQLAVYVNGERTVDLWGGEGVTGDSLTAAFSTTKGAAHLTAALLVQEGVLDLDRTVASYWPEFAAEGKDGITLRDLLGHRAGLIGVQGGFSPDELADDQLIAARLAGQRPFWRPGEGYGYHAFVIGALIGEVVRRATGRPLREIFEERIRVPYGLDFYLGLPEALETRYVEMLLTGPTPEERAAENATEPDKLLLAAFNRSADAANPLVEDLVALVGRREVRALGQASAGGVGSARGHAAMYAAALSGIAGAEPLLKPETIAEFARFRPTGTDLVTGDPDHFALGFEQQSVRYPELGPDAFGHAGAAGSEALADPRSGIAYGYVRRRLAYPGGPGPENVRLVRAVVQAAKATS